MLNDAQTQDEAEDRFYGADKRGNEMPDDFADPRQPQSPSRPVQAAVGRESGAGGGATAGRDGCTRGGGG